MNTKAKAIQGLLSFIQSQEKVILLTGTYQHRKHVLALSLILSKYPSPATVLFRANSSTGFTDFLAPVLDLTKKPRPGEPVDIQGGYQLYVDTINPRSWSSSPRNVDVALVYPLDSLNYDDGDECVQDLMRRNVKKIFLVSDTDNKDFGWTNQFNPEHVVYDAEEEDPEYHKRVTEVLSRFSPSPQIPTERLPEYAKSVPSEYLVQILCRGRCRTGRWARLNEPYPGKTALRKAEFGEYRATCLKCGHEATDNYNWYR